MSIQQQNNAPDRGHGNVPEQAINTSEQMPVEQPNRDVVRKTIIELLDMALDTISFADSIDAKKYLISTSNMKIDAINRVLTETKKQLESFAKLTVSTAKLTVSTNTTSTNTTKDATVSPTNPDFPNISKVIRTGKGIVVVYNDGKEEVYSTGALACRALGIDTGRDSAIRALQRVFRERYEEQ